MRKGKMISRKSFDVKAYNPIINSLFTPDYKWNIQKGGRRRKEYDDYRIVKIVPYGSPHRGMFLSKKFEYVIFFREHYILIVYQNSATLYDYEHELVIETTNSPLLNQIVSYNSNEQIIIEMKIKGQKYCSSKEIDFFPLLTLIELIGIGLNNDVGVWSNFLTDKLHDPRLLILIRLFYGEYKDEENLFFDPHYDDYPYDDYP